MTRKPFMPEILARIAPRLGAEVVLAPPGFVGRIRFPNGRTSYFWDNKFNLNPISSVKLASDKGYTSYFLRELGYPTPEECLFFRERFRKHVAGAEGVDGAVAFADRLGWPVVVKPAGLSQGRLVAVVHTESELRTWAHQIFAKERVMVVQQYRAGADYRLVVLDGRVLSAYERVPLAVTGDGIATVRELLETKQREFATTGRDTVIPLEDPRIGMRLARRGLTLDSIIASGATERLIDIANLSLGGTSREVTSTLHPAWVALAAHIAADIGLRFCGIDILTNGELRAVPADYTIIEINSAPGLDHYGSWGPEHEAAVDELYLEVLRAIAAPPA